jgi:hypothetical protein
MRGEGWRIATSLMSSFPYPLLRPTCVSECVSLFLIPAEMRMLLVMMYYTSWEHSLCVLALIITLAPQPDVKVVRNKVLWTISVCLVRFDIPKKKKRCLVGLWPFQVMAVSDDGGSTFFRNDSANLPYRTVSYHVFFNLRVVGLRLTSISFCCVQLVVRCRGRTVISSTGIKYKGFRNLELILFWSGTDY